MAKRNRLVYRVQWEKSSQWWKLASPSGDIIFYRMLKVDAVDHGRHAAREQYNRGHLTQLVIHKKDGKIQTEVTYGKDPRRFKG